MPDEDCRLRFTGTQDRDSIPVGIWTQGAHEVPGSSQVLFSHCSMPPCVGSLWIRGRHGGPGSVMGDGASGPSAHGSGAFV